jgi:hypothetical protein
MLDATKSFDALFTSQGPPSALAEEGEDLVIWLSIEVFRPKGGSALPGTDHSSFMDSSSLTSRGQLWTGLPAAKRFALPSHTGNGCAVRQPKTPKMIVA